LVFESTAALAYPEESFRDGEGANLVYQFRVVSRDGAVEVFCIAGSTGYPRLHAALLKRLDKAKVLLPKAFHWDRDHGMLHQESMFSGVLAESLRRARDEADSVRSYEPSDVISAPSPPYPRDARERWSAEARHRGPGDGDRAGGRWRRCRQRHAGQVQRPPGARQRGDGCHVVYSFQAPPTAPSASSVS